eukprot:TRINITY_DN1060_c0_g1_i1.p1 TRINITY_DN1060_c0_g1~~TRINITY_DN1060_c0_g1_i1.p1  ORF type:complete len:357 (+),score=77.04 TRINITY_DN1060_c0_g1_i1:153-1223(+)
MGKRRKVLRKSAEEDLDNYLQRTSAEDREGGSTQPTESLFFVDKSGGGPLGRRVHKHRDLVLRCDSILSRKSLSAPIPYSKNRLKQSRHNGCVQSSSKQKSAVPSSQPLARERLVEAYDIWSTADRDVRRKARGVIAPAVEVDAPGCSYNPTFEDHQEALGVAVAHEVRKILQKELQPTPVPRTVVGTKLTDEERFFVDTGLEEGEEEPEGEDVGLSADSRAVKVKKLTRVDLNKRKRKREAAKLEAEKLHALNLKKDILRVPELMEEMVNEDFDKEKRRIRRLVSRAERRAEAPPCLGKHKFVPEPVQVLTSDEVTGSLRKLKACYTLARDRFKSWQRRGLLEPQMPARKKKRRT